MKGQRSGREGVGSQLRAALGKLLSVVCPPIVIIALLTGYSVAAIYAQEGSSSDTGSHYRRAPNWCWYRFK